MEGGDEDRSLSGHDALVLVPRERRHGWPEAQHPRRPDEDHLERPRAIAQVRRAHCFERLLLAAIGIALDGHIDEPKGELGRALDLSRQQDHTGARSKNGFARRVELLERGNEVPGIEQLQQRRALAARHDESIDLIELAGHAHLERWNADTLERLLVKRKVSLESQNTNPHDHLDRWMSEPVG